MKARYGNWDCSPAILGSDSSQTAASLEEAVRKHAAFPIVVSAEDAYPGHGKVDAVQEVSSVWSLLESFTATVTTDAPETAGTVVQKGMTVTAVPARGYYADGATVTPEGAAVNDAGGRPVPHLVPARGLHDHDPLLCQDASCAALCRAERCHAGRDSRAMSTMSRSCRFPSGLRQRMRRTIPLRAGPCRSRRSRSGACPISAPGVSLPLRSRSRRSTPSIAILRLRPERRPPSTS